MQEYENWLKFAKDDLKMARIALPQELFAPLTYHCQQAAEKSLKGYLILKNHEIIKVHDLTKLVGLCKQFDTAFEKLYDSAEVLNPYATRSRYPSAFDIPDKIDSELAIKHAEKIMKFVLKKISEPATGQTTLFE